MAEKVSKEEMERQMIINTKKEMFDLGVEHTMNKIKQDNITNKYNNIIRKLFTDHGLSKTNFLTELNEYNSNNWTILLNQYNMYYADDKRDTLYDFYYLINHLMTENNKNKREISLLKESVEDLNEESTNTIEELDNFEKDNKELKEYKKKLLNKSNTLYIITKVLLFILIIQNLYILNYIFMIYYDMMLYLTVKNVINTTYDIINGPLFILTHYLIYKIFLYFDIKNKYLDDKYKKFINW